ncbi:VOC family protein [Gordonia sp. w5E2]|uniref:Glyoxalase n=1 Tax=Gordonia jacobaea TaxID=122202 RepID=A0ABR5I8U2_9ACTN|nr:MULTISPECIES: VOC family protein [Gordonia]KNA90109.1 glyoxalase [Gordonia jacobaea]OBC08650.1 glyoxalase [Gordonia sp. 852002-50395_SCH5434458]OBC10394.1 glyoxalase [Gordonia sp. 852002-50816_SCH5313054-a]OBC20274.1 glyoxalase [Gordonia sp. 852002-50816_SCH5313054-c]
MPNTIILSQIYVLDHDEALDFYVGNLGFEVHSDVDMGFMRWLTINLPSDPDRQLMLEIPGPPSLSPETAAQVRDLLTKGAGGGWFSMSTDDAYATADALLAKGVDFTDEPTDRDYGIDFGIRDPFGNRIRIGQMKSRP